MFPIVAFVQRRSRAQKRIAIGVVALLALVWLARFAASTMLDKWWFDTVTTAPVWVNRLTGQIVLAIAAGVISGIAFGASTYLGLSTEPAPDNGPNRVVTRYRQRMGPAHRWLLIAVAVFLTLRIASAAMDQWQTWLLFLNSRTLGVQAPEIGFDLSYHLFKLPFLTVALRWIKQLLIVSIVIAAAGFLANGALRLPGRGRQSSRRAIGYLALLGALFALTQAAFYLLVQRPSLATNRNGAFDGPGFTELNVISPVLVLLAVAALITATAAVYGIWSGRWRPTLVSVGAWSILYVLGMWLVPFLVQTLAVKPAEAERELPFIAHNLEATQTAYRLDAVDTTSQPYADGLVTAPTPEVEHIIDQVPVFAANQLAKPLQVLEGTTATRITDVDLDRYTIDGERRPVMVAARNANRADLPEGGWVQTHLVYTHGNGVVAVPADSAAPDGRPDVDALANAFAPERSELYFGEGLANWYAIVGTKRTEQGGARFDADTGIPLSGTWNRLIASIGLGDIEPLTSAELTSDSQLLYRRAVKERLAMVAPFATFDAEAYPVVEDGRITWIVDGYTRSATYPYAQFATAADKPKNGALAHKSFNYLHGSIKATVDAYDGTVHLYETEVGGAEDPILETWDRIFPGLIEPIANMPASLRSHLLYPPDLLTVQTSLLGRYHVTDPETLFNGSDRWSISVAPGAGVAQESPGVSRAVTLFLPSSGDAQGDWVAIRPYGPGASSNAAANRDILAAFAVANHDDAEHLTLVRIEPRAGRQVSSPLVAQSAIDTDPDLARSFTLLNANGSAVQFGPMTPLPLDGAMVWARSIIVTGTAGTTAPKLNSITAVSNGIVGQGSSTSEAVESTLQAAR